MWNHPLIQISTVYAYGNMSLKRAWMLKINYRCTKPNVISLGIILLLAPLDFSHREKATVANTVRLKTQNDNNISAINIYFKKSKCLKNVKQQIKVRAKSDVISGFYWRQSEAVALEMRMDSDSDELILRQRWTLISSKWLEASGYPLKSVALFIKSHPFMPVSTGLYALSVVKKRHSWCKNKPIITEEGYKYILI